MKVLVACEELQRVCMAFRERLKRTAVILSNVQVDIRNITFKEMFYLC